MADIYVGDGVKDIDIMGNVVDSIEVDGAEDVYLKGNTGDLSVNNSNTLVEEHYGGDVNLSGGSDVQMFSSRVKDVTIDKSKLELYDTVVSEIIRVTEGERDVVVQNLRRFSERTFNAETPEEKMYGLSRAIEYVRANEKHLQRLGYLSTLQDLLEMLGV